MNDNNTSSIVSKAWSYCNALRDDGVSYGDYLEQLTYLIFLKMADEYSKPPHNRNLGIPEQSELHTILRLSTGIFYAQGVKANVIFFDNKPAS